MVSWSVKTHVDNRWCSVSLKLSQGPVNTSYNSRCRAKSIVTEDFDGNNRSPFSDAKGSSNGGPCYMRSMAVYVIGGVEEPPAMPSTTLKFRVLDENALIGNGGLEWKAGLSLG